MLKDDCWLFRFWSGAAAPAGRVSFLLGAFAATLLAGPAMALSLNLTDDTFVDLGSAQGGTRYGAFSLVRVGNTSIGSRGGYARFDLRPIPPAVTSVTSAILRVYVGEVRTPGSIAVAKVNTAWNEGALVGSTSLSIGATLSSASITASTVGKFVTFDVTSAVNDWLASPASNFGLAFRPASAALVDVAFTSKENAGAAHPMELEVAFEGPPGPQGATGPQGPQGVPGTAGVSGYERVVVATTNETLAAGAETVRFANCPTGKKVLGGGAVIFNAIGRWVPTSSGPTADTQWAVALTNLTLVPITAGQIQVTAICATVN